MDSLSSNVLDCALVFEGGGYRGSFSAGVASVLLQNGLYFDYVCGLSAGASNTVNYLSRDQQRLYDSFILNDKTKDAVGLKSFLRGKGYFDADFLYEAAPHNGALPFDWNTFSANPARVCIQAFESSTGKTVRFTKEQMTDIDRMMDLVRASSTLPGAMKPLPVDGRTFYDGGLGTGAGIPLCMAEDAGLSKFLFVATRPRGYRKKAPTDREKRLYQRLSKDSPYLRNALLTRWERYNAALAHVEDLEAKGQALIIAPYMMKVESGTRDPQKQMDAYNLGRRQTEEQLPKIREFVGLA